MLNDDDSHKKGLGIEIYSARSNMSPCLLEKRLISPRAEHN